MLERKRVNSPARSVYPACDLLAQIRRALGGFEEIKIEVAGKCAVKISGKYRKGVVVNGHWDHCR
jgi:hypothetical protein